MAYIIIHCSIPFLFIVFVVLYYIILRKWAARIPIEDDEDDEEEDEKDGKKD